MRSKIALLIILSLVFFSSSQVTAESEINLDTTRGQKQEVKNERMANIAEKKETFRETLQAEKEARKAKIETMKESFKDKREAYKEKLQTIKDERKKKLTENIDGKMATVNKNQTDRMKKALEKLSEHIDKLEERITKAKGEGVDVSTVESAIASAKTAISTASSTVEQQAAKDYAFTITDEAKLAEAVRAAFNTLSQDLKNSQQSLVNAKEAVIKAYQAAELLKKPVISPTGTI